ncbi:MAG: CO dehydrogenase/acetyl-CoA synthase subunit delta [Candidatus Ranarchaeia archaeon]
MPDPKKRVISLEKILQMFSQYDKIELENVTLEADQLELWLTPAAQSLLPGIAQLMQTKTDSGKKQGFPSQLKKLKFELPKEQYTGQIHEITFGATRKEGGSRSHTITIGGQTSPPFYMFEAPNPHPPVVTADVFDMAISLPKPVKMHISEVMDDPAEWAKLYIDKFGADMVTIHLISTDPGIKDTSPNDAAKTVEEVLQAVKCPILIGGSGAPEKDPAVFQKVAEVVEGERVMLNSATLDVYQPIADTAKKHGHVVLSWTSLDINQQKELNRKLLETLKPDQIVMDPTTAALGYGIEYAFSVMERMRLSGLLGDTELAYPISSGTTNAWAAREAWLKNPELGPREYRGPAWEAITALILLLAGCDLFMMLHPAAIKTLKDFSSWLHTKRQEDADEFIDWISLETKPGSS